MAVWEPKHQLNGDLAAGVMRERAQGSSPCMADMRLVRLSESSRVLIHNVLARVRKFGGQTIDQEIVF